jgi:hypothetical protein
MSLRETSPRASKQTATGWTKGELDRRPGCTSAAGDGGALPTLKPEAAPGFRAFPMHWTRPGA